MRPAAGKKTHQLEEIGPGRQGIGGGAAANGGKALRRCVVPATVNIGRAGKIRHEEEVEMAQVIGQVFCRLDQMPGQQAVFGRHDAHGTAQGLRRRHRLGNRTDAADARHDAQRIQSGPSDEQLLETPEQG